MHIQLLAYCVFVVQEMLPERVKYAGQVDEPFIEGFGCESVGYDDVHDPIAKFKLFQTLMNRELEPDLKNKRCTFSIANKSLYVRVPKTST